VSCEYDTFARVTLKFFRHGHAQADEILRWHTPPHNFSRDAIEEAIDVEGFQLWRLGKKMEAQT
jgi:hypothetical protein